MFTMACVALTTGYFIAHNRTTVGTVSSIDRLPLLKRASCSMKPLQVRGEIEYSYRRFPRPFVVAVSSTSEDAFRAWVGNHSGTLVGYTLTEERPLPELFQNASDQRIQESRQFGTKGDQIVGSTLVYEQTVLQLELNTNSNMLLLRISQQSNEGNTAN